MPVLRVLIGAPGSGKTTWRRKQKLAGVVLCLDEARARFGWGEGDQTVTPQAVAWVKNEAEKALSQGKSVTIDSTAAKDDDRKEWVAMAQRHNVRAVAVLFRMSWTTCLTRNNARDRVVPEYALRRVWNNVKRIHPGVLKSEGFARIDIEHERTD